jgi:hypothetical protein
LSDFIPKEGELIIVQTEDSPKIKIGNGEDTVAELPYVAGDENSIDAGRITEYTE